MTIETLTNVRCRLFGYDLENDIHDSAGDEESPAFATVAQGLDWIVIRRPSVTREHLVIRGNEIWVRGACAVLGIVLPAEDPTAVTAEIEAWDAAHEGIRGGPPPSVVAAMAEQTEERNFFEIDRSNYTSWSQTCTAGNYLVIWSDVPPGGAVRRISSDPDDRAMEALEGRLTRRGLQLLVDGRGIVVAESDEHERLVADLAAWAGELAVREREAAGEYEMCGRDLDDARSDAALTAAIRLSGCDLDELRRRWDGTRYVATADPVARSAAAYPAPQTEERMLPVHGGERVASPALTGRS